MFFCSILQVNYVLRLPLLPKLLSSLRSCALVVVSVLRSVEKYMVDIFYTCSSTSYLLGWTDLTKCDLWIQKCPFEAIQIINLPKDLDKDTTHRYGPNTFKLHRLVGFFLQSSYSLLLFGLSNIKLQFQVTSPKTRSSSWLGWN